MKLSTPTDMIVEVTEIETWQRCRWMHNFSSYNAMALKPDIGKPYLDLGTLVHVALADWIAEPSRDLAADIYLKHATDYSLQLEGKSGVKAHEAAVGLGMAMMLNYQDHYVTPLPDYYSVIMPETTLTVPVVTIHSSDVYAVRKFFGLEPYDRGLEPGQVLTVHLRGRYDGLLCNQNTSKLEILEHKTFEKHASSNYFATNVQFTRYLWLLERTGLARQSNLKGIGGLLYNGLWKRPDGPAERLFERRRVLRNDHELAMCGQMLKQQLTEMAVLGIYTNHRWQGCTDCSFQDMCAAKLRGEDTKFMIGTLYKKRELPV